ncbi:hypothetical protein CRYUN_Cryun01aG0041800 [Craigia yunnanensis]
MRDDLKETQRALVLKADLPGLKKEEVTLKVEDEKILHLKGKQNMDREEAADGATKMWHHRGRTVGKFNRKLELPEKVNVYAISARMKDGVLTVIRAIHIYD